MISPIRQRLEGIIVPRPARTPKSPAAGRTRSAGLARANPPRLSRAADSDVAALFGRRSSETLRTGFGQGTVSPPTVVVRTLGRGLDGARRVVPSPEEVLEEFRARRAEDREDDVRQVEERRTERVEPALPNPVEQARGFINALNQSAATAQARLAGEEPPATALRASLRINGRAFSFVEAQANPDGQTTSRLDLLI